MAGIKAGPATRAVSPPRADTDGHVEPRDIPGSVTAEPAPSALPLLTRAIMDVPLPGAPPNVRQHGAEIGLAFVDGALRQNHVRRVSESLQLIDHGAALQTVAVDLSLSLLNEGQYRAGKAYSKLRGVNHRIAVPGRPASDTLVWVPVTRLSRHSVAPVEVLDAHGNQVPRLTQDETGRLMAPAMYRLLRSILESDPDARKDGSDLYRLLHWDDNARWLIQRALLALTTERAHPNPGSPTATAGSSREADLPPRLAASKVLRDKSVRLDEYLRLLHVVINHYFVVVGLDETEDEHTLTYRAPLEATGDAQEHGIRERAKQFVRLIRNAGNAYDVVYQSRLSTGVRSYHFAAETELDLTVHPPYLTTDFDCDRVERLSQDLAFLSESLERCEGPADSRILDFEVRTSFGRLAEIVRRRQWEAEQVGLTMLPDTAPACQQLREVAVSPNGSEREGSIDGTAVSPELLAAAAKELVDQNLGTDLSAEKDPPSSHAHAYWRKPLEGHANSLTTITVRCTFRITDNADGGPRYVGLFVGMVALLNLLIAVVLFGRLSPLGSVFGLQWRDGPPSNGEASNNADAMVAVLLLVPGFLYSRLRLPVPGTIAGRLRTFTRALAYTVILSSAVVGVLVAAGAGPRTLEVGIWISIAIDLLCCGLLRLDRREASSVPVPTWAQPDGSEPQRRRPVDVRFTGVGLPDEL